MFVALLGCTTAKAEGMCFSISVTMDWRILWPRPPDTGRCVPLRLSANGQVDLAQWASQVRKLFPATKKQWWHEVHLEAMLKELPTFSLCE
eukprot:12132661-Alexandrium_andersonii.AAC.1